MAKAVEQLEQVIIRFAGDSGDGMQLTGASDHGVSEAIYLNDPDGNGLELYRDLPREEWPRDDDGSVAMMTIPLDLNALLAEAPEERLAVLGSTADDPEKHFIGWRDDVDPDALFASGEAWGISVVRRRAP